MKCPNCGYVFTKEEQMSEQTERFKKWANKVAERSKKIF